MLEQGSIPKRRPGRPKGTHRCTPELANRLCELIRAGSYFGSACRACGISERTGYSWLEQGRRDLELEESDPAYVIRDRSFLLFLQAYELADAEAEAFATLELRKAGSGYDKVKVTEREELDRNGNIVVLKTTVSETVFDWRASLEFLKRRWPERWGDKVVRQEESRDESLETGKVLREVAEEIRAHYRLDDLDDDWCAWDDQ